MAREQSQNIWNLFMITMFNDYHSREVGHDAKTIVAIEGNGSRAH